jgi:hypothetical protein
VDQPDVRPLAGFSKQPEKLIVVGLFVKNGAASVATIEDVVAVAAQRVACAAWHGLFCSLLVSSVKIMYPVLLSAPSLYRISDKS